METIIHNIRDLDQSARSAVEKLVGHSLGEHQQLVIQVLTHQESPAEEKLPEWCNVYEGLSDVEIDAIEKSILRSHDSRHLG